MMLKGAAAAPGCARPLSAMPPRQPLALQVDGKEFHYFLSHKKEHSKHGSVPGHVALNLHDSLQLLGFRGWCAPYPSPSLIPNQNLSPRARARPLAIPNPNPTQTP